VWDNAPAPAGITASDAWSRFTHVPGASRQVSYKKFRKTGVFIAQIFTPILMGDKESNDLVEAVEDGMRGVVSGDVHFKVPSIQLVGRTELWNQTNIQFPYHADDPVE
jgi:translation initiation factor 6 (eIF-6)